MCMITMCSLPAVVELHACIFVIMLLWDAWRTRHRRCNPVVDSTHAQHSSAQHLLSEPCGACLVTPHRLFFCLSPPCTGTVVCQWYAQPLCRQVPASWTLEGSLAPSNPSPGSTPSRTLSKPASSSSGSGDGVPGLQAVPVSLEQVLALRPGRRFASLLLVVAVPGVGGPWWKVGELAVELDRLGRLREQVRKGRVPDRQGGRRYVWLP